MKVGYLNLLIFSLFSLSSVSFAGSYLTDSGEVKDDEGDEYMTTSGKIRERPLFSEFVDDSGRIYDDPYSYDSAIRRQEKLEELENFAEERIHDE